MYYLRSRPAADAIKFTVDIEMLLKDAGQIEIKSDKMKQILNPPCTNNGIENKENSEYEVNGKNSTKKLKIDHNNHEERSSEKKPALIFGRKKDDGDKEI